MALCRRAFALLFLCASVFTVAAPSPGQALAQGEQDVYEYDDSPEAAKPMLLVNLPQHRTFHTPDDPDWAYFFAEGGERVAVYTTGTCDTVIFIYGPDGRGLAEDDDGGEDTNALARFVVPEEGNYYVMVRRYPGSPDPCDEYQLFGTVVAPPAADSYEPDNDPASAKPLSPDGAPQTRTLHVGGDQDWAAIQVTSITGLQIQTASSCDTYLYLYGTNAQTVLAQDDDGGEGGNAQITHTITDPGTYYVRARHYDESVGICDEYRLTATAIAPTLPDDFEPDDTASQAKALPLEGTAQQRSFHTVDDVDWASFEVGASSRVFLNTGGACDTMLTLFAADGQTILAEDDDSGDGANAALVASLTEAGRYFVRIRLFAGQPTACATYALQGVLISGTAPATGTPGVPTTPGTPGVSLTPMGPPTMTPSPTPTWTPIPTRTPRPTNPPPSGPTPLPIPGR